MSTTDNQNDFHRPSTADDKSPFQPVLKEKRAASTDVAEKRVTLNVEESTQVTVIPPPEKKRMTSSISLNESSCGSEDKKGLRQQRNRQAARRSREKKNQSVAETQLNLQLLAAENKHLKSIVLTLHETNKNLQVQLAQAQSLVGAGQNPMLNQWMVGDAMTDNMNNMAGPMFNSSNIGGAPNQLAMQNFLPFLQQQQQQQHQIQGQQSSPMFG